MKVLDLCCKCHWLSNGCSVTPQEDMFECDKYIPEVMSWRQAQEIEAALASGFSVTLVDIDGTETEFTPDGEPKK